MKKFLTAMMCALLLPMCASAQTVSVSGQLSDTDDNSLAGGAKTTKVLSEPYMWNGSNWVRLLGDATNGLKVQCILGCSGVSDTDDGTIAGGQITGIQLDLMQAYDGSNWKRFTFGTAGTPSTQVLTIQGITNGTVISTSVASVIPGTGATNLGKAEDAAHASGDTLVPIATKRTDSAASSAGSDGDYATLNTDASGRLWVICGSGCSGGTQYAEDSVHVSGDTGTMALAVRVDTPGALAGTTGDYAPLQVDATGSLRAMLMTSAGAAATLATDATADAASSATGPQFMAYGKATAPTAMSTDGDATPVWTDLNGRLQINISQLNGVTPLMGNGGTGTGSLRVTIASDNTAVAGMGVGATGSAVPANANYIGGIDASGNLVGDITCGSSKIYDASTNGNTELVAISGSKDIYVCGYEILAAGTVNVSLVAGTGTACASAISGTPSTGTSGAAAALTPAWQFTTQTGKLSAYPAHGVLLRTGTANALCLKTSGGVAVQAQVFYQQR